MLKGGGSPSGAQLVNNLVDVGGGKLASATEFVQLLGTNLDPYAGRFLRFNH